MKLIGVSTTKVYCYTNKEEMEMHLKEMKEKGFEPFMANFEVYYIVQYVKQGRSIDLGASK